MDSILRKGREVFLEEVAFELGLEEWIKSVGIPEQDGKSNTCIYLYSLLKLN